MLRQGGLSSTPQVTLLVLVPHASDIYSLSIIFSEALCRANLTYSDSDDTVRILRNAEPEKKKKEHKETPRKYYVVMFRKAFRWWKFSVAPGHYWHILKPDEGAQSLSAKWR